MSNNKRIVASDLNKMIAAVKSAKTIAEKTGQDAMVNVASNLLHNMEYCLVKATNPSTPESVELIFCKVSKRLSRVGRFAAHVGLIKVDNSHSKHASIWWIGQILSLIELMPNTSAKTKEILVEDYSKALEYVNAHLFGVFNFYYSVFTPKFAKK